MINLISQEEKKKITRGFYYRTTVLFLVVLNIISFVAFIAVLPSYFLSIVKKNIVKNELEEQKNEPVPAPDQKTLDIIKDLDNKLTLIEKAEKEKFPLSTKVINAVVLKRVPNIKITNIAYDIDPVKGKKISIQGTAPSREVLLLFRKALEENTIFKSVDLPISNFVKGSNIQFYLSVIPS